MKVECDDENASWVVEPCEDVSDEQVNARDDGGEYYQPYGEPSNQR